MAVREVAAAAESAVRAVDVGRLETVCGGGHIGASAGAIGDDVGHIAVAGDGLPVWDAADPRGLQATIATLPLLVWLGPGAFAQMAHLTFRRGWRLVSWRCSCTACRCCCFSMCFSSYR